MTRLPTRTIPEVAADLRMSLRVVRRVVVENGLCLVAPGSNRRRMTEDQVTALIALLKVEPCQSKPIGAQAASTISAAHTSASALTRALELAAQSTQRSSQRKRKERFSSATSKAPKPSQPLPKLRLITSQAAAKAGT